MKSRALADLGLRTNSIGYPNGNLAGHTNELGLVVSNDWDKLNRLVQTVYLAADGLNWDLLNDGRGNPKNTKSLLLAHRTPPVMSLSVRETAETAVRSGIRHILFTDPDEEVATVIDDYLKSLKPMPSPHLVNGGLSPLAES